MPATGGNGAPWPAARAAFNRRLTSPARRGMRASPNPSACPTGDSRRRLAKSARQTHRARASVLDLRPLLLEAAVNPGHVVVLVVALLAGQVHAQDALALLLGRLVLRLAPGVEQVVPLRILGVLDVLAGRAVAALAADIAQVRRALQVHEAALVAEADRVADNAF